MSYKLNMKEVTYSLSSALDLVGIDDNMHGKRVAYMAVEIAKELSLSDENIDNLYSIGMLHDCGVSSTNTHRHLVNELDWDNSQEHCLVGERLLNDTSVYKKYASYIRYHHTHWKKLPENLDDNVKDIANLIYMADRVDALRAQVGEINAQNLKFIQNTIKKHSDAMFKSEFVDAFLKLSSHNYFWFFLDEEPLNEYFQEWIDIGIDENINFIHLKEIALMFASIVDAKSAFTSEHSIGVSLLAKYLADLFELEPQKKELIELTALFHDLGKLKVDDEILNKPAKLNEEERLKMNRHGFDSYVILKHIKGFKDISYLASLHHETLDGEGYPYGLQKSKIPFEARLIAVADIFQALVQNRPYREGLTAKEALEIIQNMTNKNKLDSNIVEKLSANLEHSYNFAIAKNRY